MSDSNDLFDRGRPNPALAGIPSRFTTSGSAPDEERIASASKLIGVPVKFVDADGYEREIVAATPMGPGRKVAYVESRAKDLGNQLDINFFFVVRNESGQEVRSSIESYNPYFGCDVGFLEWYGEVAVLIYQEKHDTYVAASGAMGVAQYKVIASNWVVHGTQVGYWKYKDETVRRCSLPGLVELPPLTELEAQAANLCPPKYW